MSSILERDEQYREKHGIKYATRVGSRIRSLREEKGWSLEDLAERVNRSLDDGSITTGTLGQIERGDIEDPSGPVLGALAVALSVSKDSLVELAGGEDEVSEEARTDQ